MATSGRIPALGFGVSIGAVVLLGFGNWSAAGGGHQVSARAYPTNVVSARGFATPQVVDGIAYATNTQRARASDTSAVSAEGYPTNRANARAFSTEL
jgi:hypothetical protein